MKNIKWLLTLASRRPLIFSLALLMIAVSTLALVVANRDKKLIECSENYKLLQIYYDRKFDSLSAYYRTREVQLNEEVKITLSFIIEDYKIQLEEQKLLNQRISSTIRRNKKLIINNNRLLNSK